jgi:hypothetical protein
MVVGFSPEAEKQSEIPTNLAQSFQLWPRLDRENRIDIKKE